MYNTRLEAPSRVPLPSNQLIPTILALMSTFTLIGKVVGYSRGGTEGGNDTHKYNIDSALGDRSIRDEGVKQTSFPDTLPPKCL